MISVVLTACLGMLVERVGYRPLRDAPRASAAITGLMIGIILETGVLAIVGGQRKLFPSLIDVETYKMGGVFVTNTKIMIVVVSVLLMLALHQFVQRSKWGMAMRAMAYDFVVVPLMGVSINTIARMTFAIGSGLAAIAGIMFGLAYPVLDPLHGHHARMEGLCGRHSGRSRFDHGRLHRRLHAGVYRNFRGHDLSVHTQGPDRLFDRPWDSGVQAPRPLRRTLQRQTAPVTEATSKSVSFR